MVPQRPLFSYLSASSLLTLTWGIYLIVHFILFFHFLKIRSGFQQQQIVVCLPKPSFFTLKKVFGFNFESDLKAEKKQAYLKSIVESKMLPIRFSLSFWCTGHGVRSNWVSPKKMMMELVKMGPTGYNQKRYPSFSCQLAQNSIIATT